MTNILDPDINVECLIPFAPKNLYICTGVIADGSCFYHAFLRITHPSYKNSTHKDRVTMVDNLRKQIADTITIETITKVGKGELKRMLFFKFLNEYVSNGFPTTDERGSILNNILSLSKIIEENTTFKGNFYLTVLEKIEEAVRAKIGNKYLKFNNYIKTWLYEAFVTVNQQVVESYRKQIMEEQVSATEIGYISNYVKYNFLFLRQDTNGMCQYYSTGIQLIEDWPIIVLLWKQDCHYEIVGEMHHNRIVKRMFTITDPFIVSILVQENETTDSSELIN